jgi:PPM family protein phosphatase
LNSFLPEVERSGLSVIGPVREDNQDAIHLHDESRDPAWGQLYAIADGMGGYSHGGVASSLALDAISKTVFSGKAPKPGVLKAGVENANLGVYKTALQMGVSHMGTTLTAVYLLGDSLHLVHVGDSRAYLIRQGRANCLTADHTAVGDMVRANLIPPSKLRTHINRSILTRAVGIGLFVQADISRHRIREDDYIILCSDGIWSVIEDEEFAELTGQVQVEKISQALVDLALKRDTDDNASVVVLHIKKLTPVSNHSEPGGWFHKFKEMVR